MVVTLHRIVVDRVLFVVEDLDASRPLYTAALGRSATPSLYVQEDRVRRGMRRRRGWPSVHS
jgi:hypothetical protein